MVSLCQAQKNLKPLPDGHVLPCASFAITTESQSPSPCLFEATSQNHCGGNWLQYCNKHMTVALLSELDGSILMVRKRDSCRMGWGLDGSEGMYYSKPALAANDCKVSA